MRVLGKDNGRKLFAHFHEVFELHDSLAICGERLDDSLCFGGDFLGINGNICRAHEKLELDECHLARLALTPRAKRELRLDLDFGFGGGHHGSQQCSGNGGAAKGGTERPRVRKNDMASKQTIAV